MLSDVHIENTKNEADTTEGVDLHSPALEIEGIVQGEPDNNIVQSGDRYTQDDSTEKVLFFAVICSVFLSLNLFISVLSFVYRNVT